MGLDCTCGVRVDGSVENVYVKPPGSNVNQCGTLTYLADVCADRLNLSSLSLTFESLDGKRSFVFNATDISEVSCQSDGQNCSITVTGVGEINRKQYNFSAEFRDQETPTNMSIVSSFVISGFFNQIRPIVLDPGDIMALGCGEDD